VKGTTSQLAEKRTKLIKLPNSPVLANEDSTSYRRIFDRQLAKLLLRVFFQQAVQSCRAVPNKTRSFTGCGKTQRQGLCNKGTAFSRANKFSRMSWALAPANPSFADFAFHSGFFRSLFNP
jgi:hypothetical protein